MDGAAGVVEHHRRAIRQLLHFQISGRNSLHSKFYGIHKVFGFSNFRRQTPLLSLPVLRKPYAIT
jgi:hypothetical protein